MANKAVTKKETSKVATSETFSYGDDERVGFEGVKAEDLAVPFMGILQSNSPLVENCEDNSARSGMFVNTVTGEIIDGKEGFPFIPVYIETAFAEWVPRTEGGGFVELHDPNGEFIQGILKNNGGSRIPPKGDDGKRIPFRNGDNELIETFYVYGLLLNDEGTETSGFAVLSFTSTKIKPYRNWVTSMLMIKGKPPMFANRARIRTVKQSNKAGTFSNFDITPFNETWSKSLINPATEEALLIEAKGFREMVLSGMARADFNSQEASGGEEVSDKTAGGGNDTGSDDEIPF